MLEEFVGHTVLIDLRSPFVCLGTLAVAHELWLEVHDADLHDLRDTRTSRENYIASSVMTGIKRNRKRVLVARSDVVAVSRLDDFVDE